MQFVDMEAITNAWVWSQEFVKTGVFLFSLISAGVITDSISSSSQISNLSVNSLAQNHAEERVLSSSSSFASVGLQVINLQCNMAGGY